MSKEIDNIFERANDFFYKNDYDNAFKLYKKVLEEDPAHSQTLEKLAKIEVARKNFRKAVTYYVKSLEIDKDDTGRWLDLGNVYYELNQYDEAIKCYKKTIELKSDFFWAYYNIGLALKQKNESPEKTLEWYEKALKYNPNYYPALNEIGLYHYNKKDYDTAEEYFKKAVKICDTYKYSYLNLGLIYKNREQNQQAQEYFYKALQIDPNYVSALNNMGIIYYEKSDYITALYYYTRAFENDSKYIYALYNIGLVFGLMEKYKKAFKMYQRALKIDPQYQPAIEEKERIESQFADKLKTQPGITEEDLKSSTYEKDKVDYYPDKDSQPDKIKQKKKHKTSTSFLEKFGRNLTKMAEKKKLFEIFGREQEMQTVLEVLFKIKKNNPVLVGRAGVGKTAIVEGLAQKIVKGEVPDFFKDKKIIEINMGMLIAGTQFRGDFEKRLKMIVDEVKANDQIILFIDEIHTVLGAGQTVESSLDAANILKPYLARGEIRCIGATTTEEYKKYFEKDKAFARRFYKIPVPELDTGATLEILKRLKRRMEKHYAVKIDNSLLKLIVELCDEEIKTRVFPDKAIDVMENSFSRCALAGKKEVDEVTVKGIVGEFVGIKFLEITEDKGSYLLNLETFLKERVYGQDEAIEKVTKLIQLTKQRLDLNPEQPDGVFLFAGPTGVGKTYLAKQVAQFLFGAEDKLISLNMSEYTEPHSVAKLIGSPPGYVGYDDIPIFSSKVLENPSCLLLMDEIEKAHAEVLKLFLRIFDEGKVEDTKGRIIYFANVTIMMTSNLMAKTSGMGFVTRETKADIKLTDYFPPEFVNRIDEVIIFNHIDKKTARRILKNLIMKNAVKSFAKRGIEIKFNPLFIEYILEQGYSARFGVRNLERVFEKEVLTSAARFLYEHPHAKKIIVSIEDNIVKLG